MRYTIALIIVAFACTTGSAQFRSFELRFDNEDPKAIGFRYMEDDQSVGPRAVAIADHKLHIPDPVHGNIKVLDAESGTMEVIELPTPKGENSWLRDIMLFDRKLLVTSDLDIIYVVHPGGGVDRIDVPRGEKYFAGTSGDTIQVFMPVGGRMLHIDLERGVIGSESTDYRIHGYRNGQAFSINRRGESDEIATAAGTLELPGRYQIISEYYDGINVDFTYEAIAYFSVHPEAGKMMLLFLRL